MKIMTFSAYSLALILLPVMFSLSGCDSGDKTDEGEVFELVEVAQESEVCGGIAGIGCADEQFCDKPEGTCDTADMQGVCTVKPEMCTRDYRPVCGCDGKTYGNDCGRLGDGVSKDHDGECKTN